MSKTFPLTSKVFQEGKAKRKKIRKHRFLGLPPTVWENVKDFCQNTSLHGLKYISSIDVRYIERYMWLVLFFVNLSISINLTHNLWVKWRERPFLVTYDSNLTPIFKLPFPSVTVCSYISVRKSFLDLSATNNKTLLYYSRMVCSFKKLLAEKVKEIEFVGNDFYEFIKRAAPSCSEMFSFCSFGRIELDCCEIFDPVVTTNGLCYNFNHLPMDRILKEATYKPYPSREHPFDTTFWNPQDGYFNKDLPEGSYPRRQYIAQVQFGLSLKLDEDPSEWQELCSGAYSGFKLIVASPSDLPQSSTITTLLTLNRDTHVMVTPTTLHSPLELVPIHPAVRSCYFASEHPLQLFRQYSESNCDLECVGLHYLRTCGCVPFFYPRNSTTRICSMKRDPSCLLKVKERLTRDMMENLFDRDQFTYHPCGCYKGCHEVLFKTSISSSRYSEHQVNASGRGGATNVGVYYGLNQFLGRHRKVRFTTLNFVASCGGILSLFLGFSMISCVEVVYAFCLRPLYRTLCGYSAVTATATAAQPRRGLQRGLRAVAPPGRAAAPVQRQPIVTLPPVH